VSRLIGAVLPNCHRFIAQSDGNARNIRQFFGANGSHAEVWLRSPLGGASTQRIAGRQKPRRPGIEFVSTVYRGHVPIVKISRKILLSVACAGTHGLIIRSIARSNLLPETIAKRSRSGETW
jgi:hypothetical protein